MYVHTLNNWPTRPNDPRTYTKYWDTSLYRAHMTHNVLKFQNLLSISKIKEVLEFLPTLKDCRLLKMTAIFCQIYLSIYILGSSVLLYLSCDQNLFLGTDISYNFNDEMFSLYITVFSYSGF